MNSENSKTFKYHVLILNLTDKIDLTRGEKPLLYQIVVLTIHGKTRNHITTIINLEYLLQHGMTI